MEELRIIPTYKCNKNCYMCYQPTKDGVVLLPEKLDNILYDLRGQGFNPTRITYMGGELSLIPQYTKRYIEIGKQWFPTATSSLTTNGNGTLSFYKECIATGLSCITVSMHEKEPNTETKLLNLKKENIKIRVNCYLNYDKIDAAQYIFNFCSENAIPLTFCTDLRVKKKRLNVMELGELLNICKPHYFDMFDSYAVCKIMEGFTFWVFWSSDYKDIPNRIILPSGRITTDFQEVLDGKS